mgnify:FL=1
MTGTGTPTATPTATSSGSTAIFQSDSIAAVNGLVTMNFTTYTGSTIEIQLRWSADTYAAIGIATTAMSGPIALCYITSGGVGSCTMKLGSGFSLGAHPASSPFPATLPILQTVLNADLTRSITFRVDAAALNINIQSASPLRTLSSVGQMSAGSPLQHSSRQAIQVAWARSTTTQTATPMATSTMTGTSTAMQTATPTTTPTSTSLSGTVRYQSPVMPVANGAVQLNFTTYVETGGPSATPSSPMDVTLTWIGATSWAAIGVTPPSATDMSGPIALCHESSCTMYRGEGYSLMPHASSSAFPASLPIIRSTTQGTSRNITFRVWSGALNVDVSSAAAVRVLAATGLMGPSGPNQHAANGKAASMIAWYAAPTTTAAPGSTPTTTPTSTGSSTPTATVTPSVTSASGQPQASSPRYVSPAIVMNNGVTTMNFSSYPASSISNAAGTTTTTPETMEMELAWSGDTWAGIGIAPTGQMSGPIVVCYASITTASPAAECKMYRGAGFSLLAHPTTSPYPATLPILRASSVTTAGTTTARHVVVFRVATAALTINATSNLAVRTLSASGVMSPSGAPQQHSSRQAVMVSYYSSSSAAASGTSAVTSTGAAATSTTTLSTSPTVGGLGSVTFASPAVVIGVPNRLMANWTSYANGVVDIRLRRMTSASESQAATVWAAVGVAATDMSGPIALCALPAASPGTSSCSMRLGNGFSLGPHPSGSPFPTSLEVLDSSSNATERVVTFRVTAAAIRVNATSPTPLRSLFAVGLFSSAGSSDPQQHASADAQSSGQQWGALPKGVTEAPVTTRPPLPPPPAVGPVAAETLTPAAVLGGSAAFGFKVFQPATTAVAGTTQGADPCWIDMTFSWPGDKWVAVGPNSPSQMNGPLAVCYVPPSVVSGAMCTMYYGTGVSLGAAPAGTDTTLVVTRAAIDAATGMRTITMRVPSMAANLPIHGNPTSKAANAAAAHRWLVLRRDYEALAASDSPSLSAPQTRSIFASGPARFSDIAGALSFSPSQHPDGGTSTAVINWATGDIVAEDDRFHMTAIWVASGGFLLYAVITGVACRVLAVDGQSSLLDRLPAWANVILFLTPPLALVAAYAALEGVHNARNMNSAPIGRGFGHATAALLALLVVYAAIKGGPLSVSAVLLRTSYERLIPVHGVLGFLVWLCMTVHMGMMLTPGNFAGPTAADVQRIVFSEYKNIAAAVTYALTCLLVTLSFLSRRAGGYYSTVFVLLHKVLALLILSFAAQHYLPVIYVAGPAMLSLAVSYLLDMVGGGPPMMRLVWYFSRLGGGYTVSSIRHDKPAGITVVHLLSDHQVAPQAVENSLPPAAFALLRFRPVHGDSAVSAIQAHPFSIAWGARDASTGRLRLVFLIKACGPFTTALATEASRLRDTRVVLNGPYGHVTVPVSTALQGQVLLAAGGVGVTAMLGTLQALGSQASRSAAASPNGNAASQGSAVGGQKRSLVFLWVLRETSIFEEVAPMLLEAAATFSRANISFHVIVYATNTKLFNSETHLSASLCIPNDGHPTPFAAVLTTVPGCSFSVHLGRCPFDKLFSSAAASPHGCLAPALLKTQTSVYACGPVPMVTDLRLAVDKAGVIHFHAEDFSMFEVGSLKQIQSTLFASASKEERGTSRAKGGAPTGLARTAGDLDAMLATGLLVDEVGADCSGHEMQVVPRRSVLDVPLSTRKQNVNPTSEVKSAHRVIEI